MIAMATNHGPEMGFCAKQNQIVLELIKRPYL